MLFKPALVATTALATLAAATPLEARTGGGSTCSSGEIRCCENVGTVTTISHALTGILGGLPIIGPLISALGLTAVVAPIVGGVDVVLGATCSSIDVLGGSCNSQTVCCQNVAFNGLINVGCTAINL